MPKRLGYLAEALSLGVSDAQLRRWQSLLGSGITLLERGGLDEGRITSRWRLRITACVLLQ